MKKELVINWLRCALVVVCTIACLILLMAEPEGSSWFALLIATKFGAIICGVVAFAEAEKLSKVVCKENN